jgi:hypothetical protein
MSYTKGVDWDHHMDAHLLRGLQNRSDSNNNDPSPANGTVAILIVLLALFCFLWYDTIDPYLHLSSVQYILFVYFHVLDMMILTNVTLLLSPY